MSRLARPGVLRICAIAALLACAARDASAQLDEHCTVSVLNRSVTAKPDGSWVLANVPANFGLVRARATCLVDGTTVSGESDLFLVPPNGVVNLKPIVFGQATPIPTSLTIAAPVQTLTQAGASVQLEVSAHYAGGAVRNVTAASTGTQYTVSNAAIATVSGDGVVQARTSGSVIVQATLEGASGLFSVQVSLSTDTDGDGMPDDYELAQGLDPNNPLDAQEDPDHDGFTNLQEFQLGTDPHGGDADGDGLSDGDEVNRYHTNPFLADTDGDSIPDGVEVQTGSNPLDRNSYDLRAATQNSVLTPSSFVLVTSPLLPGASLLLDWKVTLIDGKTTLDLTADPRTSYSSSALTICNFGAEKGRIFAGSAGSCVITLANNTLSATASGTVQSFTLTSLSFVTIPGFANGVAVNGNYAYVAAGSAGLQVVDVTNRAQPHIVASLALLGNANDIKVLNNLAYIAAGSGGLHVVDVSNPIAPIRRGTLATGGNANALVVRGTTAYVANGTGLFIADVTNPSAMSRLAQLSLTGVGWVIQGVDVDPQRNLAVVAAGIGGVYVVDVSNATAPVTRGHVFTTDARNVTIRGTLAYVADRSMSLTSIDISVPSAPLVRSNTPLAQGGRLNDVALSGNFALGADVFFVNGVPITDISDDTALHFRATLNFPQRDDNGMAIAADGAFVYLATDRTAIDKGGSSGDGRLYIGQFLPLQDSGGVAPTVQITSPALGATVIEGGSALVRVDATDDVAVSAVNFLVNGQVVFADTTFPYEFTLTVPAGAPTVTLGATAVDLAGNVGTAPTVQIALVPDPLTTVVGRILDRSGLPFGGATVTFSTFTTTSAADGTFSIAQVPTAQGGIVVSVSAIVGGKTLRGRSRATAPVPAGTTNVGDIKLRGRLLFLYSSIDDYFGTPANEGDAARNQITAAATAAGLFFFTAQDVDILNLYQAPAPPLAYLLNYDAVLQFEYTGQVDQKAFWDRLADYVDHGGGVVAVDFYKAAALFGGRLSTGGYLGLDACVFGGTCYSDQTTNALSLANSNTAHPIMQGVTGNLSFAKGSLNSYWLRPGSIVVARDTTNAPRVAIGPVGNGKVVSIAIYPGQGLGLGYPPLQPGIARLFANALDFVR